MKPIPALGDRSIHLFPVVFCRDLRKMSSRKRAFTLLEMLIAISVIAIVLLAVYRLHSQTILMNISSRFYTAAPLLAKTKLAEVEVASSPELVENSGDFGEDHPGYSWEIAVTDIDSAVIEKNAGNVKRIDVKVLFNQGELAYSLRSYRYF